MAVNKQTMQTRFAVTVMLRVGNHNFLGLICALCHQEVGHVYFLGENDGWYTVVDRLCTVSGVRLP